MACVPDVVDLDAITSHSEWNPFAKLMRDDRGEGSPTQITMVTVSGSLGRVRTVLPNRAATSYNGRHGIRMPSGLPRSQSTCHPVYVSYYPHARKRIAVGAD
jgi:hypothetical protein